jgi:GDP-4-dehydro-6-deoxy-D-mannose reductase
LKALITGVDGFVGGHLAHHLLAQGGFEVFGTTFGPTTGYDALAASGVVLHQVDLTDASAVQRLFKEIQPDQVYHLAAQSFVPASYENPWATLQNNIHAQLNVLHTIAESSLTSRVLVVGSAEEYGPASPDAIPINEQRPLRPTSPYSVSKVTQDMLGLQYFLSHNVAAIRVRPFNHTGPGQSPQFVVPAFASQIAEIETGRKPPVILVGNLEARRDISDVRDVVQAYEMLLSSGTPGEVYNIGRGVAHSIQEILDTLLRLSSQKIEVQSDPLRYRPIDSPLVVCDSSKVRAATGWTPRYSIEKTIADVLGYWRVQSSGSHPL